MFETLGERIAYIQKKAGGAKLLQDAAGISQSTLSRLINNRTSPTVEVLVSLARCGGVSLSWAATGEGAPEGDTPSGYVAIQPLDRDQRPSVLLDAKLLEQHGVKPEQCALITATDDAMQGTINAGHDVLVNLARKRGDGIFAVNLQGSVVIRRLQFLPNGDIKVISDNSTFDDYTLSPDEQQHLEIIGRRVWHGGF